MKPNRYFLAIITGTAVGILFVHPLTMVIAEFFHWYRGSWHFHWYEIPSALRTAYSIAHLPNAFAYGVLSTLVSFFWAKSNSTYRQIAEQSERFALIGREASTIVHDINNPLFGITTFTELIREDIEDEETLGYCTRIDSSVDRISGLVAEIKTLAMGEGRMILAKKPTPLDRMAQKTAREIHLKAEMKIDAGAKREISVDPLYFGRVLLNILKNADEALRESGNPVVTISMQESAGNYLIEIADNGPGVPPKLRKTLFELGVTHGKERGTGLGLYAARRIVEAHEGRISCRNRPGGGTIFSIELPAR